jgi:hypothetical protein
MPGVWAEQQTITDFEHTVAAKHLRHGRADPLRPVADPGAGQQVEIRSLGCYVLALGLVDAADERYRPSNGRRPTAPRHPSQDSQGRLPAS